MWNKVCKHIFLQCIEEFDKNRIRYFLFRNYELLPENNESKDIDIVVEPNKIKESLEIVKKAYRENGLKYYDQSLYNTLNCTHGIAGDLSFGIHIDLLAGYVVKGYEIYTFDEMYSHTTEYNGMMVLEEPFNSIILIISKMFGYKKIYFKEKYIDKVCEVYNIYTEAFEKQIKDIFSEDLGQQYIDSIKKHNLTGIVSDKKQFNRRLKTMARKKEPLKTTIRQIRFLFSRISRIFLHYKRNRRVIIILNEDEYKRTKYIQEIADILNCIYVDDKCSVYNCNKSTNAISIILKMPIILKKHVHYDRVSIVSATNNNYVHVADKNMIYQIYDGLKASEVLDAFCEHYMEKL